MHHSIFVDVSLVKISIHKHAQTTLIYVLFKDLLSKSSKIIFRCSFMETDIKQTCKEINIQDSK